MDDFVKPQPVVAKDVDTDAKTVERPVSPVSRSGDVISPARAVMTLSKSMLNAGVFSLPYAWKLGGLWVSFVTTFVIAGLNWYGNYILVRSSQHLAKKSDVAALDYGHFAKKVCDTSDIPFLRHHSKGIMYGVNLSILFYQLGLCSVAIIFIADNMVNLVGDQLGGTLSQKMVLMCTVTLLLIMATNMFTEMRIVSFFAFVSSVFFVIGAAVVLQYSIQQPSKWRDLPAATDFTGIMTMYGMTMYAFEGQTMILPVENKLERPEVFLAPFGVLSITMVSSTACMAALGYFGYTAFGDSIATTITTNVPKEGFYSTVNGFLMIQSVLGNAIAMYVVYDMFMHGFMQKFGDRFPKFPKFVSDKGFRLFWVLVTYLMAVLIPKLEIMMPLVGITSGTLCALVYPPIFELVAFWSDLKSLLSLPKRMMKIAFNCTLVVIGILSIFTGLYFNTLAIIEEFSKPSP